MHPNDIVLLKFMSRKPVFIMTGRGGGIAFRLRKLWYKGLTRYTGIDRMGLSDEGARVLNRILYKED